MADKRIKAILFDLDGVLVDAREWHFEALNRALASFGYAPIAHAEHLARYDGLPTLKKLALLAEKQPVAESQFADIASAKQRFTIALIEEKCVPSEPHIELLQFLKREGYKLAVCSNSVRASVDLLLEKAGLEPFFEFTLSNEDVQRAKPDPEIYMAAMRRFGVAPEESLILEDNMNGITAARASGAHVHIVHDIGEVCLDTLTGVIARIESE